MVEAGANGCPRILTPHLFLLTADGCIKWLYSNTAPHLLVILPMELYPYPQLVWLWLAPKVPDA